MTEDPSPWEAVVRRGFPDLEEATVAALISSLDALGAPPQGVEVTRLRAVALSTIEKCRQALQLRQHSFREAIRPLVVWERATGDQLQASLSVLNRASTAAKRRGRSSDQELQTCHAIADFLEEFQACVLFSAPHRFRGGKDYASREQQEVTALVGTLEAAASALESLTQAQDSATVYLPVAFRVELLGLGDIRMPRHDQGVALAVALRIFQDMLSRRAEITVNKPTRSKAECFTALTVNLERIFEGYTGNPPRGTHAMAYIRFVNSLSSLTGRTISRSALSSRRQRDRRRGKAAQKPRPPA